MKITEITKIENCVQDSSATKALIHIVSTDPVLATESLIADLARHHPEMEFCEICRAVKRAASAAEASFNAGPPEDEDQETLVCEVCGIEAFEDEALRGRWLIDDQDGVVVILCPACQLLEPCDVCRGSGNLLTQVHGLWLCPKCHVFECHFCQKTTNAVDAEGYTVSEYGVMCPECYEKHRAARG
jgi:hypothetical protein